MVKMREMLVAYSKYGLKCPHQRYPEGITVHNTANDASANNEVSYMINNNYETSFHYAVDDIEAVQGIPLDRNSWHASDGNGFGNLKTISIEICYSKSGGERFDKAEQNAAELIAFLLKDYNWGIDKVDTHQHYARDNKYCPHRTLDKGWQRFLDMIRVELNKLNGHTENSKPNPIPTPSPSNELYRIRKSWADAASQKGAYSIKENAIAECKKHSGYSVFDSKGNVLYSNGGTQPSQPEHTPPQKPSKRKIDSFIKVDGYPWVKNLEDYAGVFGVPVKNFYAYPSEGEILFRVSPVNKDYYPWVQNYKTSTGYYDFAGNGVPIDRVQMKLKGLPEHRIKYRVRLLNGDWLPWVYDDTDYAGIRGRMIDAIEVEIV